MKNKNGITLIAVIVTVVVLLILTGISLSALTGNDSFFTKVLSATKSYDVERIKEEIELSFVENALFDLKNDGESYRSAIIKKLSVRDEDGTLNEYEISSGKFSCDEMGFIIYKDNNGDILKSEIDDNGNLIMYGDDYERWNPSNQPQEPEINDEKKEVHIYTCEEFKWVAKSVNTKGQNNFEGYTIYLENDLDFGARKINGVWEHEYNNKYKWDAIGTLNNNRTLKANIDGKNHVIKGLYIVGEGRNGFIGNADNVEIKNIIMQDSYVTGAGCVGAIAGYTCGNIENCHNKNTIVKNTGTSKTDLGGIVGHARNKVINCTNTGFLKNTVGICGGIVGSTTVGVEIKDCINYSDIDEETEYVAGICGYLNSNSTTDKCFNYGNVMGLNYIGGIVGGADTAIKIVNSCNTGKITGKQYVGGIVGHIKATATLEKNYNSGTIDGEDCLGGIIGRASVISLKYNYNKGNMINPNSGGIIGLANMGANNIDECYYLSSIGCEQGVFGMESTFYVTLEEANSRTYAVDLNMSYEEFLEYIENV